MGELGNEQSAIIVIYNIAMHNQMNSYRAFKFCMQTYWTQWKVLWDRKKVPYGERELVKYLLYGNIVFKK